MNTFAYLTVASSLHDPATVERVTTEVRASLDGLGGVPATSPEEQPNAPMTILVATGGTERQILEQVRRRQAVVPWEPVLLVAHPLHNSLPAALEAMARLHRDGVRGRILQVGGKGVDRLATAVADVAAIHRLHRTRLGQIGAPSEWLVASIPDADLVRARWGIELVPIDIAATIEAHRRADPARPAPWPCASRVARPPPRSWSGRPPYTLPSWKRSARPTSMP